jgi:uncharacterized protein YkwD
MNRLLAVITTYACLSLSHSRPAAATPPTSAGTPSAEQILKEINLARSNPLRYAAYLRNLPSRAKGMVYKVSGSLLPVPTREGAAAVDEAIRFLERQKPLPALSWSPGLSAAADELAREQTKTGDSGHLGTWGGMGERIERHGSWTGCIGENIAYGSGNARAMVMQLIIDDGVPGREHRKNIFHRSFAVAGISCAPHPRFGTLCVMDFAGKFLE